ncbi:hypothetical protein ACFLTE_09040 [Bacteroidota bacterium]
MIELIDKIKINSTPDKIWDTLIFYFKSTDNYKLWHKDHISCYWKKGKDFSHGSILIAEELIHGKNHKLEFKIQSINKENLLIEYKMLFPFSIICSGGYFKLISYDKETEFIAQLGFRLGFLLKILFKRQVEGLKEHMKEEGQNIKEFIEKA